MANKNKTDVKNQQLQKSCRGYVSSRLSAIFLLESKAKSIRDSLMSELNISSLEIDEIIECFVKNAIEGGMVYIEYSHLKETIKTEL